LGRRLRAVAVPRRPGPGGRALPRAPGAAALTAVRVSGYEVEAEIGRGGSAVVHRARSADGRAVALKLVAALDPERKGAFDRERRLLAAFGEADGFVPLLDAGQEGGRAWF